MQKFYAVKKGRKIGVFTSWEECKKNTVNYSGAIFKSFKTKQEAFEFLAMDEQEKIADNEEITMQKKENEAVDIYHTDEKDIFSNLKENEMIAYIDGSYEHSRRYFAYAGIMFYNNISEEFAYACNDEQFISMRNVAGEVKAAIYVIQKAADYNLKEITIYYDYSGIENWAKGYWKTNNNLTKSYKDFCEKMSKEISINFVKVKSHTNIKFNEYVDKLAKKAIEDAIVSADDKNI